MYMPTLYPEGNCTEIMIKYARENLKIGEDTSLELIRQWYAIHYPKFKSKTVESHAYMNSKGSDVRMSHPMGRAVDIFQFKGDGVFTRIIED